MRYIKAFGQFWYDFIVGDDWKIAAAVVITLVVGTVLMLSNALPSSMLTPVIAALVSLAFSVSLAIDVRPDTRR